MKDILILSCSTGQGHNSCAEAIKEYFEEHGVRCVIKDAFGFISEKTPQIMSHGHSKIYRHMPKVFSWSYQYCEKHPEVFGEETEVYRFLTAGTEQMHNYIVSHSFDTIICTHVFSAMMLTHLLKQYPLNVMTAFVATDYTCSPSMEASNLQYYFVPDASLVHEFVERGISQERIITSGIPIRQKFFKHSDKKEAKKLLHLPPESKHLVMMCGSMGCGSIETLLKHLVKMELPDVEVTVICGTNLKLQKKLQHKYKNTDTVHIKGYINNLNLYLDSADCYMTKPGGISVTEAAGKNLPMIFINAVAGCEDHNMRFFLEKGAAVTAPTTKELAKQSVRILQSQEENHRMVKALQEYHQPNGAEKIFKTLTLRIESDQREAAL